MSRSIRTKRLTLRPLVRADENAILTALGDLEVTQWLSRVPHPFTKADVRISKDDGADRLPDLIGVDLDGQIIGTVGTTPHFGYWFARSVWGFGYGKEACRAAIDHVFEDQRREEIASGFFEGNIASQKILTRLGFLVSAHSTQFCRALGRDLPYIGMKLERADWLAARA